MRNRKGVEFRPVSWEIISIKVNLAQSMKNFGSLGINRVQVALGLLAVGIILLFSVHCSSVFEKKANSKMEITKSYEEFRRFSDRGDYGEIWELLSKKFKEPYRGNKRTGEEIANSLFSRFAASRYDSSNIANVRFESDELAYLYVRTYPTGGVIFRFLREEREWRFDGDFGTWNVE